MTHQFAERFAEEWIEAWNSHDLDRILSHYTEDFSIETPMALKLFPHTKGIIKGKVEIREYWKVGIERIPDLKFELLDLLTGINNLAIYYVNIATNKRSVEMMSFNSDHKVNKVVVTYTE